MHRKSIERFMFSLFLFSIVVTCKPCSDEDVLMAVCTSDFGKCIYTKARIHIV